jgi:hypothetical protein
MDTPSVIFTVVGLLLILVIANELSNIRDALREIRDKLK